MSGVMLPEFIGVRFYHCLILGSVFLLVRCGSSEPRRTDQPEVLDERLSLSLIDASPNIMTPIGLAIDDRDHLYVLESHTHSPPSDYPGPAFDRIKRGVDEDQDGRPESWIIYADSITDGMNLAIGPDNILYLTEKNSVWAYQDTDDDGKADRKNCLLHMPKPDNVYDHAGILGVTYAPDGWLYVSRGNTGGQAWRIEGSDGSYLEGYGDGGNVMRCRSDGSQLEEVATGFWNPFDLTFSQEGRLLLVDNDPDSRGPNRLIEVVRGGDYGYQSLYGGSGIHPFLAWNGELPGTLPYAAALGEAPSGLLDASFSGFPEEYTGDILCTIWEENSIVRVPLQPSMSTVQGQAKILIKGDSTFHPVALAANSRGDVYFTDWVVRQYPNHGQGKIWRLSSEGTQPLKSSLTREEMMTGPFYARLEDTGDVELLLKALASEDPFIRTNARYWLRDSTYHQELLALTGHSDASLRLQALLSLSESLQDMPESILRRLLNDKHEEVRRMALIYAARNSRSDLYQDVHGLLSSGKITPLLFETYLATLRHLQPDFIRAYRAREEGESKNLKRELPSGYLAAIIRDASLPDEIRAAALPYLDAPDSMRSFLVASLDSASATIQVALLQTLKQLNDESVAEAMLQLALDSEADSHIRGQALVALQYQSAVFCEEVAAMLAEENELLSETAVDYLCRCPGEVVEEAVAQYVSTDQPAYSLWLLCRGEGSGNRPDSDEAWVQAVNGEGNAERGKLVFQSVKAQCQHCHKVDGWGGDFGPDLSNISSSKTQSQLISAILEPSLEIAPEWQGWFVTTKEGATRYGRQIDVGLHHVELMNANGDFVTYEEPQRYGPATASLMPEGLENAMTESEFNDLIAYLTTLK